MRKSQSPSERGFTAHDRQRLAKALTQTGEARVFRRLQAVRLIAEGRTVLETARITGVSLQSVYNVVQRYLQSQQIQGLYDLPHPGRPPAAPQLTASQVVQVLQQSPLTLGYRTNVWTVKTLAVHLSHRSQCSIAPWTLRRRMKPLGLVCKRPRYFYAEKPPHRAQKKGPGIKRARSRRLWIGRLRSSLLLPLATVSEHWCIAIRSPILHLCTCRCSWQCF